MGTNAIAARNNPVLQEVALGAQNELDSFIAKKLFPAIKVEKLTGDIKTYGKDHLRIINTVVEDGGTKRMSFSVTKAEKWDIENHQLTIFVSEKDIDQLGAQTAKNDAASINMETLMLSRENATVSAMTTAGNYTLGNTVTLAGGDQWSAFSTSTPREDLIAAREEVRTNCGRYPNVAVLNPAVLNYLVNHPQIRDAAAYKGEATVSMEMLKTILFPTYKPADCEILIGAAQYNSANKGQTGVMTDLWGKVFIYAFVNRNPNPSIRQNSLGYSFNRGKDSVQVLETRENMYRENEVDVTDRWEYDDVVLDFGSAYLISAAVA